MGSKRAYSRSRELLCDPRQLIHGDTGRSEVVDRRENLDRGTKDLRTRHGALFFAKQAANRGRGRFALALGELQEGEARLRGLSMFTRLAIRLGRFKR